MKIEAGNEEYFLIDGVPQQRGSCRIFVNSTMVGLKENGEFIEVHEKRVVDKLDTFTNSSDGSFASIQDWVDYVKTFIFIKGRV